MLQHPFFKELLRDFSYPYASNNLYLRFRDVDFIIMLERFVFCNSIEFNVFSLKIILQDDDISNVKILHLNEKINKVNNMARKQNSINFKSTAKSMS